MLKGKSKCPHCKSETDTGTRGGCGNCGKVKTTKNGRIRIPDPVQE